MKINELSPHLFTCVIRFYDFASMHGRTDQILVQYIVHFIFMSQFDQRSLYKNVRIINFQVQFKIHFHCERGLTQDKKYIKSLAYCPKKKNLG